MITQIEDWVHNKLKKKETPVRNTDMLCSFIIIAKGFFLIRIHLLGLNRDHMFFFHETHHQVQAQEYYEMQLWTSDID